MQQRRRVGLETPPGGGERHPGLTAHEQGLAEPELELLDSGADGRLGDIQGVGGPDEAPGLNHLEKCPDLIHIHRRLPLCAVTISTYPILTSQTIHLPDTSG